jgi:hypothetical protein
MIGSFPLRRPGEAADKKKGTNGEFRTPKLGARLKACVRAARAKRISVRQEHHTQ